MSFERSFDWWVRLGYYTRGVLFTLVGVLALRVALGRGGALEGTRGTLRAIGKQPHGQIFLSAAAIGLTGYVAWRFVQAASDPGFEARGVQRVIRRVAFSVSGCFYAVLALSAAGLALGVQPWSDHSKEAWTAWLLSFPLGWGLVMGIGGVVIGVGVHALYRAYVAQFMQLYRREKMNEAQQRTARYVGAFGLAALGVTLLIIGGLLVQGGWLLRPDRAGGIAEALHVLLRQPRGPVLLAIAALGLVAYGGHCFWLGRFRQIRSA